MLIDNLLVTNQNIDTIPSIELVSGGSNAKMSPIGGSLAGLTLDGKEVIFSTDRFPYSEVGDPKLYKGVVREISHLMIPRAGSGSDPVNENHSKWFFDEFGVDPSTLRIPKHGFVSAMKHEVTNQTSSALEMRLLFPGADFFPWPFETVSTGWFEEDGSFTRQTEIFNVGEYLMPMSLGFHTFHPVFGGDSGINNVRVYHANGMIISDLSNYLNTEADQVLVNGIPDTYFIETPTYRLKIQTASSVNKESVLNIWTDAMHWRKPKGSLDDEFYLKDSLSAMIRRDYKLRGIDLTTTELKNLVRNHKNNRRYFCVEPVVKGFNMDRGESKPLSVGPGERVFLRQNYSLS